MKYLTGIVLSALVSTTAMAAHEGWMATLSPSQELHTPSVSGTNASCYATFVQTTPNRVRYRLGCLGLSEVTAAHIHGPADADNNGPVIVTLYSPDMMGSPVGETLTNVVTRDAVGDAAFDAMLTVLGGDQGYVNVHTAADPMGAVRGQIIPVSVPDAPYVPF